MSDVVIAIAIGAIASNLYWLRRTTSLRRALTTSRDRDERVAAQSGGETTLQVAAERADCKPSELPDQIGNLRNRIRVQETELERTRQSWAASWWDALQREPIDVETPHVLSIHLETATAADVQKFAHHAQSYPSEIALVVGLSSGTFAVSVGDALVETYSAADIATEIADRTGGGAGGSEQFATGGGADANRLQAIVKEVHDRLAAEL